MSRISSTMQWYGYMHSSTAENGPNIDHLNNNNNPTFEPSDLTAPTLPDTSRASIVQEEFGDLLPPLFNGNINAFQFNDIFLGNTENNLDRFFADIFSLPTFPRLDINGPAPAHDSGIEWLETVKKSNHADHQASLQFSDASSEALCADESQHSQVQSVNQDYQDSEDDSWVACLVNCLNEPEVQMLRIIILERATREIINLPDEFNRDFIREQAARHRDSLLARLLNGLTLAEFEDIIFEYKKAWNGHGRLGVLTPPSLKRRTRRTPGRLSYGHYRHHFQASRYRTSMCHPSTTGRGEARSRAAAQPGKAEAICSLEIMASMILCMLEFPGAHVDGIQAEYDANMRTLANLKSKDI
ncbi:hypothetical protein BU25DRAFT_426630 [Macroventuria anomochaeta]|uniref:Uncharacterized protein n=1 Tax=Macroventuria anomochaeta TaxID=301207 RepID=A0ACB6RH16_9PLEO|nr:uncharacterized protein BU25DRAFT_426630 [Macroventuria anomochaeta]KAF2621230.1 hypothetical protein BU25DRAFT_426630 [Macroventuria anomochaeta]